MYNSAKSLDGSSRFEKIQKRLEQYRSEGYTPEFTITVSPEFHLGLMEDAAKRGIDPNDVEVVTVCGYDLVVDESFPGDSMYIKTEQGHG